MMKKKHDDGLEWLRAIRRRMAPQFHHDPKQMGRHYREMQRRFKGRIYRREEQLTTAK
jgi:hypothetical protein